MIHQKLTLFICLLLIISNPIFAASESQGKSTSTKTPTAPVSFKKSPESYFSDGIACLKKSDIACAEYALANIPSQTALAKLLTGFIAAANQDYDGALRALLPFQSDSSIGPEASSSLHLSLALAYDNQGDAFRALEQRIAVDDSLRLTTPISEEDIKTNEKQIWKSLSSLPKDALIEMRGNSYDTTAQGWIDLALTNINLTKESIQSWRKSYPDHPATIISGDLEKIAPALNKAPNTLNGSIAIILPFLESSFYPISDAIQNGFLASQSNSNDHSEVKIYPSQGDKTEIINLYKQAISEGAKFVVGPLTKEEVNALSNEKFNVPTITLETPDIPNKKENSYSFSLTTEDEVKQIVKNARGLGMQKVGIVYSETNLDNQAVKIFSENWISSGGQVLFQVGKSNESGMNNLKSDIASSAVDMIFIAADAENARIIRPYIVSSVPTYALSHIYSGLKLNAEDAPLLAIHFVDMPWMIDRDNPIFKPYRQIAEDLPTGEMQRWFALGVDAYNILCQIAKHPETNIDIDGLTGKIHIHSDGTIDRELIFGAFGPQGVVPENMPN